jgi:hypothetical protein
MDYYITKCYNEIALCEEEITQYKKDIAALTEVEAEEWKVTQNINQLVELRRNLVELRKTLNIYLDEKRKSSVVVSVSAGKW